MGTSPAHIGKYFHIRNVLNPQLVLELRNGSTSSVGTPVVVGSLTSSSTSAEHRLWIMDVDTGTIRSLSNGHCIDINADNQLVVEPFTPGRNSQQWVITEDRVQTLDDFEMVISSALTSGKDDDDDGEIPSTGIPCEIRDDRGTRGQLWTCEYVQARYFYIRCAQDLHKVFDVQGKNRHPGAPIIVYADKGDHSDNQLWFEDHNGIIRSKLNGFVISASDGETVVTSPYEVDNPRHQWTISASSKLVNRSLRPAQVLELRRVTSSQESSILAAVDEKVLTGGERSWSIDYVTPVNDAKHIAATKQSSFLQKLDQASRHLGRGKHFVMRSRVAKRFLLEVKDAAARPGTPVIAKSAVAPDSDIDLGSNPLQTFYFDDMTSTIRVHANGFCVEAKDGAVVINPYDSFSNAQQWTIASHYVTNRHPPGLVLTLTSTCADSEGIVRTAMCPNNGSMQQQWDIQHLAPKCFTIVSQMNGKVVEVKPRESGSGTKVVMSDLNSSLSACSNQLWYEDERGIIRSSENGFAMDSSTDNTIRLQPIQLGNKLQHWVIVGDRIQNRHDSGQVLDIVGASSRSGAHLCAYKFHGGENQRWTFHYV